MTLDGPDGWRGWFCKEGPRPHRIRRQQGGGDVMFWAAIIGNELVGPFRVADGVKMTAKLYIDFIQEHLVPGTRRRICHSGKRWYSCMIMPRLMLQGLPPNIGRVFLRGMGKLCNGQPVLQI